MYSYQTGKFPHVSSRRGDYQMVLHNIDSNSTWVEAMKNITEGDTIICRTRALDRTNLCGISSKHQVLDNEASNAYKEKIQKSGITYQLVLPYNHRRKIS